MHAVRARPLQNVKNNIEPDEQREEADTIPPRGVLTPRHASLRAHAPAYVISPHKGAGEKLKVESVSILRRCSSFAYFVHCTL